MPVSPLHRPHSEAAPRLRLLPTHDAGPSRAGFETHRFEIVSRGDFVPGWLQRPRDAGDAASPALLLVHPAGGSMQAPELEVAARWSGDATALAAIDLPLHGRRSSPKLSARLHDGLGAQARGQAVDVEGAVLIEEFARQSLSDLLRTLEALAEHPSIDADRIGLVGFGLGAALGAHVLAEDSRARAAVLMAPGAELGQADLDPARALAGARERPLLVVADEDGESASNAVARALLAAAAGPTEKLEAPVEPGRLGEAAQSKLRAFLAQTIG